MATFVTVMMNHDVLVKTSQVIKIFFTQEYTLKVLQILVSETCPSYMHGGRQSGSRNAFRMVGTCARKSSDQRCEIPWNKHKKRLAFNFND